MRVGRGAEAQSFEDGKPNRLNPRRKPQSWTIGTLYIYKVKNPVPEFSRKCLITNVEQTFLLSGTCGFFC